MALNLNQDSKNVVSTKCLNISFTEGDAINLQKTYPMEDEEGKKLTPYTFTLKNECNDKANYQINLETLTGSTLDINYVKVKLNNTISILGSNTAVTKTLSNAIDSRMLETGTLNDKETKTYNLNLWLSNDAPNETMNKSFEGKITVTASYHALTAVDVIKDLASKASTSSTDVYTVPDKTSDTCTYTLAYDGTTDNNLRYVGKNPCNYVKIDNEFWRIIGVMNNIDDGTGNKESRIKLIRDEAIGQYSWDTSDSTVNSDYGYATSGGSTSNRTSCLAKELYNWSDNSYSDCKNNDWFYDSNNTFDWNLSPRTGDIDSSASFRLDYHGDIQTSYTYNMRKVHPTIYLISSTTITDGLGTKENPYVLGR